MVGGNQHEANMVTNCQVTLKYAMMGCQKDIVLCLHVYNALPAGLLVTISALCYLKSHIFLSY